MKKITIILLILILSLTNCGVKKTKVTEQQKIEILIDSLNYNVLLPENWKPILDSHNLLSYSPKNLGDIFYKNIIRIYETKIIKNKNVSLSEFVNDRIKGWNKAIRIDSQNLTKENTEYGETYIYQYEDDWNFTHYRKETKYFKYNGNFYSFNYSSDKKFYDKYLTDANYIFNNLKFIEIEKPLKNE
jgi:hypothetical protein